MKEGTGPAPWVTWYGDDFTGSAAVMEVLAFSGVPAVLFTDLPSPAMLRRFEGSLGIGIASTARSHGPDWMNLHLPGPLRFLHGLGAPILHYKICSTFDWRRIRAPSAARSRSGSRSARRRRCRF